MNTWTDYKAPTIMIPTGDGQERPVRGLALEDLTDLVINHLDELMDITALYVQMQKDVIAVTNMTDIVMVIAKQFPDMLSEVISMVTDTPELRGKRLPVGLQMAIVKASISLTIQDAGGLGNLSAILQNAIQAAVAGRGEVSHKLQDILSPFSTTAAGKTRVS